MDTELLTMLVRVGIDEAPAIIDAIHAAQGTVQHVGPMLDQDKAIIAGDLATLAAEQAAIAARRRG